MASFAAEIEWSRFKRVNLNEEVRIAKGKAEFFACGDARQALLWLLRSDVIGKTGTLQRNAEPVTVDLEVPGLESGRYEVVSYDTGTGAYVQRNETWANDGRLAISTPPFAADLAIAVKPS